MATLSPPEYRRYNRHIKLTDIGVKGQERLKEARVLVIGVGALGAPVLQYLNTSGTGTIGIVDYSIIEENNLHGQLLFNYRDIGKHKSIVAKKRLEAQNPYLNCEIYNLKLKDNYIERVMESYDLVIDSTDNVATKYLINDACIRMDKPMVYGYAMGYTGEVSVFNYPNGPSYRCLYPQAPSYQDKEKEGVISTLSGIIGALQANEAIKIITGAGEVLSGKRYTFNAFDFTSSITPIQRNPDNFDIK